jgi:PAS domain S-box-containing protein
MKDLSITNIELAEEISVLKKKIRKLGQSELTRMQAEESLRESENKYRSLVETATDWVWAIDLEGCHTYSNPAIYQFLGYQVSEVTGTSAFLLMHPEDEQSIRDMIKHCIGRKVGWQNISIRWVHKDGSIRSFESNASPIVNADGQIAGFSGVNRDITERKRAEEALQQAHNELEQRVADRKKELMRVHEELRTEITERKRTEEALQQACDEMEQRVADRKKELIRVNEEVQTEITERKRAEEALQQAHNELERHIADRTEELIRVNEELRTEITERKRTEEAIVLVKNDLENTFDSVTDMITIHDEDFNIVRANQSAKTILGLQQQEGMSLAKCFMFYHGTEKPPAECASQCGQTETPSTVEMFEPYLNKHLEIRAMPKIGSDGRLVGLIHIVRDITERKKAEEQLQHTLDSLRKAVGTTIQVMASAVETRDPYTAGHQIRTAALARNIAGKMGLSQDKIDAIRMAGSIHDIGKLFIPAEILSKLTKLSEIEFLLIKEHSKKGYEILKDVESSWPLAEIAHQHHERMDGSGYPRNLKGEDICIEARILAVADVVEAMASNRPYRPGLGIDAALNEIEKNRGLLYDSDVADACLSLFREKGFILKGPD